MILLFAGTKEIIGGSFDIQLKGTAVICKTCQRNIVLGCIVIPINLGCKPLIGGALCHHAGFTFTIKIQALISRRVLSAKPS